MIHLLDLNYTLVANSMELSRKQMTYRKKHERYRKWLIDTLTALKPEAILLITIRPASMEQWTLENIARRLDGWQPDGTYFNTLGNVTPPVWKEHAINTLIFPKYGDDGGNYLGIESNRDTQRMYEKYGIRGLKAWPPNEDKKLYSIDMPGDDGTRPDERLLF